MPAKSFEPPKGWAWCVEDACGAPGRAKGKVWCGPDPDCTKHNAKQCQCRLFKRYNKPGEDPGDWQFAADQGASIDVEDWTEYTCACVRKEEKKKHR
jgi:hypothetical protein